MNKSKTHIFPLLLLLMLTFIACERLEIPTTEEEQPQTPDIEEQDSVPATPTEEDSLSLKEIVNYINTHGSTEEEAFHVYDLLHLIPRYLENIGANGIPDCYVAGYIVGHIPKNGRSITQTIFAAGNVVTNIVIADSPDEKDPNNCIAIQLSTSSKGQQAVRTALNLADHPENLGKGVILHGYIYKYMGVLGLKNVGDAILYTEK